MKTLGLLLACAAAVVAQVPPVSITTLISPGINYPPVGLGSTETMQVNITTQPSLLSVIPFPVPATCAGTVAFLNSAGTAIEPAMGFKISDGQTFSVALPFGKAGMAGIRGQVRVQITITPPAVKNALPCSLQSSLETFDSVSGATHVYISNPQLQSFSSIFAGISAVLPNQN
jgi:hypothetical protein